MLYLGVDSGTQSTKAIVLDLETGAILAQASQTYGLIAGLPPGHLEQPPEEWFSALKETVSSCLSQLGGRRREVRGIGVSGQQHGLVVLDGGDGVVRPAKLWCDTSTVEQCAQFAAAFGGQAGLIAKAGNAILPGYTIPKLLWLKQNEPGNFGRVRTILLPHDYLNFRLTGVKRMEYGDASGTGILDVRTRAWDLELAAFVDPAVEAMLPPLGSSNGIHGTLLPGLAEEWGLSPETIVSAGGGDNMMGAIGTGNLGGGVVTASFGTSGTLYACSETPIVDPKGEVAAFCDSTDRWLPLVCTMNVTVVTEQVRSWFGWDLDELERQIASVPSGAEGLAFLPYLNGERTPNLPQGTGVLHGLGAAAATPAHLARAAMEGATLGLGYGLRRFAELGLAPSEIRLTGGGSRSAVWRQIAADVFGVPVVALATAEGAGLGGAIQAAFVDGQGSYDELSRRLIALDESTRCDPGADRVELYREKLDRQIALTSLLRENGWL